MDSRRSLRQPSRWRPHALLAFLLLPAGLALVASPAQHRATLVETAYFGLLTRYQQGDFASATAGILKWPERDINLMRRRLVELPVVDGTATPDSINARAKAAAVMFHTDAALEALAIDSPGAAQLHLDIARLLTLTGKSSYKMSVFSDEVQFHAGELIPGFTRRWLLATTRSLTDLLAYDVARKLLGGGQYMDRLLRGSWLEMIVAAGCLEEGSAFVEARELETGAIAAASVSVPEARKHGEAAFRRALEIDPGSNEAWLRLGHVLLEQGRLTEARSELAAVFARDAATPRIRYLAALFLGGLSERQKDLDAASRWYRQALAIDVLGQAARVGLAAVLEKSGDLAAGVQALQPFVGRPRFPDSQADPWTTYPRGEFEKGIEGMELLRQMVMNR